MTVNADTSYHRHGATEGDGDAHPRPLVLVFVRAENDLDHIAPVMESLLSRRRVDLCAIVYDPLKSFEDDPRIQYLRRHYGLDCRHALRTAGAGLFDRLLSPWLQRLMWMSLDAMRRGHSGRVRSLLMRFSRALRKHLEARLARLAGERLLAPYLAGRAQAVAVFDHTMADFAVAVAKAAQARGIQALALPHAVVHRMDAPDNPGDEGAPAAAENALQRPPGSHGYNLYDAVVAPNQFVCGRMVKRGVLAEKVAILGAARFSTEWTRHLREMLPRFTSGHSGKAVLFILSKQTPLVDWPAVEQVIAHLAATPGLDVVIKVHPRSELSGLPALASESSVSLAPHEWNTASLIDWSDLVIFWGSSAIYDALRIGKPIIQLGFATSSRFDFEDIIPSWQAATFESFQQELATFLERGEVNYKSAEREAAISELLDSGQNRIPTLYAEFIEDRALIGRDGVTERQEGAHPEPVQQTTSDIPARKQVP